MKVEWDEKKNKENIKKHGVSFTEASEVFEDPLSLSALDRRSVNNMKKLTIKEKEDFELEKEYDLSKGFVRGRFYRPRKVSVSLRLDDDLLIRFKKIASEKKIGYQTLINAALREHFQKSKSKSAA